MTALDERGRPPQPHERLKIDAGHEFRRELVDRLFRYFGFGATFFGLAMLVIFLSGLAEDCIEWFRIMPARVERQNEDLRNRAAQTEEYVRTELAAVDRDEQLALAGAKTDAEKQEIRDLFAKVIRPDKQKDLDKTAAEYRKDIDRVRTDLSAWGTFKHFVFSGPSYVPEDAGIWPALLGSVFLGAITIVIAVPVGVGAALYLEEYAPHTWLAKIIQININNLAGIPSVVFGILGAYVFVELIFKPMERQGIAARNVLGGGMTLALLTLPVIIVSAQEAIRAVPISIRHGAYALGATKWQTTWSLVLPCSIPGILTGTILALCRAMGEAAPLVLFGALLYVSQSPTLFSRFTVMPMQIFGWADLPDHAWELNAAMASVLLLVTVMGMNAIAIFLRQKTAKKTQW